jgi:DNA-binding GntR family transcriptional regulator
MRGIGGQGGAQTAARGDERGSEQMRRLKDVMAIAAVGRSAVSPARRRHRQRRAGCGVRCSGKSAWTALYAPDHYDTPKAWDNALAEHRIVFDAIGRRDAEGARAAMQRHLDRAYKRFSRSWDTQH